MITNVNCEHYVLGYCIQVNKSAKVGIAEKCDIAKYPKELREKYIKNCRNRRVMKIIDSLERKVE